MSKVERFVHGVTIGTNAILQGHGSAPWMLVTNGFRDVLEIARTNRPTLYNIKTLKQRPIIPRTRTLEIDERMYYHGGVCRELNSASIDDAIERLRNQREPGSVAVCFLHSYANPDHERKTREKLQQALPGWYISLSSDVLPQFREYERFNTTALNTFIGPLMARYLDRLRNALRGRGYPHSPYITTSNGGVSTAARAIELPITTVLSGPAGGVAAAIHLGRLTGIKNMITCDMGGTSTDVCLIEDLAVPVTDQQFIGGYANRTPQIAINAVGAGGGSIAWLDRGNILMVGPQSAGADPGPACYNKGGTEATVTDANLLLNRLSEKNRLAGRIAMDKSLSLEAVKRLAAKLSGIEPNALAEGVLRIAVARMVSAIKHISVANGHDPRDFTLVAFGGAGPMHASAIADELEMTNVLIPVGPGNFCAFGSLISDIRRDHVLTKTIQVRNSSWEEIDSVFSQLEREASKALIDDGVPQDTVTTQRTIGMRYLGQSWELQVPVPPDMNDCGALEEAFSAVHRKRFGHITADPTEIVNFRVAALGIVPKPDLPKRGGGSAAKPSGTRDVFFNGAFVETPLYERDQLPPGQLIRGPAIIDESGATTVVPPEWKIKVLPHGDMLMERISS
jgi:N-methylhydantoinase A